ncbi:hypothetical protein [Natronorubrum sp. FCH18a]|uniref:hypothetical protein n=1 Tax=Natronorubrum sp. FCH18a TaxID=3447018 RepID=UPI003F50DAA4
MSVRAATANSIDWRDPAVLALGALFVVNLIPLSSAVRTGAFAELSMSLAVCYALGVAAIGVSRGLLGSDVIGFAFSGGLAAFAAVAFVLAPSSRYAALAAAFGACSVYYCWRLVDAS